MAIYQAILSVGTTETQIALSGVITQLVIANDHATQSLTMAFGYAPAGGGVPLNAGESLDLRGVGESVLKLVGSGAATTGRVWITYDPFD